MTERSMILHSLDFHLGRIVPELREKSLADLRTILWFYAQAKQKKVRK